MHTSSILPLLSSLALGACAAPPLDLCGVLHDQHALRRAHDVELQGDIAFVAGKGGNLALIDVSNPEHPTLLSAIVDDDSFADTETVLPAGDVLYVGARDFIALDVTDPSAPVELSRVQDRTRVDAINGMVRRGDWVLTANKIGYVTAFDVSDPARPVLFGAFDTDAHGGPISPHDIALWGDRIVVVDAARRSPANVQVYRVFDRNGRLLPCAEWVVEGSLPTSEELRWDLGGANRVAVDSGFAFVGAYSADRVGVVELGERHLTQIANIPCCDLGANGLALAGQALFVSGGECVEVIDVSNPSWPVSVARFRAGALFPNRSIGLEGTRRLDNGHDLVYRDGYLFVTAQNDDRLGVLHITDPAIRALADRGRTQRPARWIE